ncbi:putative serine protease K12H4.7 [Papilio machaon]|uniref:putative serine protease K12H4.7 n=1 Tax=Papilio machaon TaxID=76193 RepID=UPI001E663E6C|nr:putative serine protease K12H4.7 [Papilio machaon]
MLLLHIFKLLIFTHPICGFVFNGRFRHLVKEVTSIFLGTPTHETRWLEQKLDHFDEKENRTWNMRYFKRNDLWRPNGPVILFIGGESEASPGFLYGGMAYELAKETNGVIFASEHRYYGKSVPLQFTGVDDFKYLSAKQSLADNAHLIRTIKLNPLFSKAKVVVIGGSYAGNLAAWMRLLYPELVDAAVASSGPVLAKKDFYEYLEKVNDVYEQYGTNNCLSRINDNFKRYETLFETEHGIEKLKKEENICPESDMSVPENKQLFFLSKASDFMGRVQYGRAIDIKNNCEKMNETKEKSELLDEPNFWREESKCNDYDFNRMVDNYYKNKSDWTACWTYQTCTEFGYFQSSTSNKQPFTNNIPVDFFVKLCMKTFGSEFNDTRIEHGIERVNAMYEGLHPNVTKVVFVNGDMDPWSRLGILEDVSYDAPAIIIPRASHCRDLVANYKDSEDELKEAIKHIKYLIKKWIGVGEFI